MKRNHRLLQAAAFLVAGIAAALFLTSPGTRAQPAQATSAAMDDGPVDPTSRPLQPMAEARESLRAVADKVRLANAAAIREQRILDARNLAPVDLSWAAE